MEPKNILFTQDLLVHVSPRVASRSIIRGLGPALTARLTHADAAASELPRTGLVRDPVERFTSAMLWRNNTAWGAPWLSRPHSIDECLAVLAMDADERYALGYLDDPHFLPQSDLLAGVDEPWPAERSADWWHEVVRLVLPQSRAELPRMNVAPPGAKPEVTDAQIAEIRRVYEPDYALHEAVLAR